MCVCVCVCVRVCGCLCVWVCVCVGVFLFAVTTLFAQGGRYISAASAATTVQLRGIACKFAERAAAPGGARAGGRTCSSNQQLRETCFGLYLLYIHRFFGVSCTCGTYCLSARVVVLADGRNDIFFKTCSNGFGMPETAH